VVDEALDGVDVYIRAIVEIRALCLDEVGLKKRVVTVRDVAFKLTNGIITGSIGLGEIIPRRLFEGWNERDV
jgi:hypothetical protein